MSDLRHAFGQISCLSRLSGLWTPTHGRAEICQRVSCARQQTGAIGLYDFIFVKFSACDRVVAGRDLLPHEFGGTFSSVYSGGAANSDEVAYPRVVLFSYCLSVGSLSWWLRGAGDGSG